MEDEQMLFVCRQCVPVARRLPHARRVQCRAERGSGFDVQFGWPYALLAVEVVCVAAQLRLPLAVGSVLLVLFQTPQDNQFLKFLANSGIFSRYKDARFFCQTFTAFTFASFLVVSYIMALTA